MHTVVILQYILNSRIYVVKFRGTCLLQTLAARLQEVLPALLFALPGEIKREGKNKTMTV